MWHFARRILRETACTGIESALRPQHFMGLARHIFLLGTGMGVLACVAIKGAAGAAGFLGCLGCLVHDCAEHDKAAGGGKSV